MNYILDTNVCIKILKCNNNKILEKISTLNDAIFLFQQLLDSSCFMALIKVIDHNKHWKY